MKVRELLDDPRADDFCGEVKRMWKGNWCKDPYAPCRGFSYILGRAVEDKPPEVKAKIAQRMLGRVTQSLMKYEAQNYVDGEFEHSPTDERWEREHDEAFAKLLALDAAPMFDGCGNRIPHVSDFWKLFYAPHKQGREYRRTPIVFTRGAYHILWGKRMSRPLTEWECRVFDAFYWNYSFAYARRNSRVYPGKLLVRYHQHQVARIHDANTDATSPQM